MDKPFEESIDELSEEKQIELFENIITLSGPRTCVMVDGSATTPNPFNKSKYSTQNLLAVLETQLGPENFREILAVLKVSLATYDEFESRCDSLFKSIQHMKGMKEAYRLQFEEAKRRVWFSQGDLFYERHFEQGQSCPVPEIPITDRQTKLDALLKLLKVHATVQRLIHVYQRFALDVANNIASGVPAEMSFCTEPRTSVWPELTFLEHFKLCRAFLRYELCCRMTGEASVAVISNGHLHSPRASHKRGPHALSSRIPEDEIEEIMCIKVFVQGCWESMYLDFFTDLYRDAASVAETPERTAKGRNTIMELHDWLYPGRYASCKSPGPNMEAWVDCMSRLGLNFLAAALEASPHERRDLIRSTYPEKNWLLAPRFLGEGCGAAMAAGTTTAEGLGRHATPFVRRFVRDRVHYAIDKHCQYVLRRLGWVFFSGLVPRRGALQLPCPTLSVSVQQAWGKFQRFAHKHPEKYALPRRLDPQNGAIRISGGSWRTFIGPKHSLVAVWDDGEARLRFLAGARAIMDCETTKLPSLEEMLPDLCIPLARRQG